MPEARTCSHCEAPLAGDEPDGFCPACALQGALNLGLLPAPAPPVPAQPACAAEAASARRRPDTRHPPAGPKPLRRGEGPTPGTQQFGDYELLGEIARGGMGIVYRARQIGLDRVVALKLILFGQFADEAAVKRFRAESTAAARLQHPNIVAIHEVGEQAGQHFFSMDYVAGKNLADLMREGPVSAKRAAGLLKTIAEAIHYAHGQGIVHRDLKPSNILLDDAGEPRVTDFGLAKNLKAGSDLTLTGQVLGSPNFIAPEQVAGKSAEVGPCSDIFSLGAILYQLLTGRPPFAAETLTDTLHQVLTCDPLAPRLLNPATPRDLETICLKCLQKNSHQRYSTAQELAEELGHFLCDEPIQARPVSNAEKLWRWARRHPTVSGLSLSLGVVFLAGFMAVLWQLRRVSERELAIRLNLYVAHLNVAQQAVENSNPRRAIQVLDGHRPKPGEDDLRGFEWRYLWRLCQGEEVMTFRGHTGSIWCLSFSPDQKLLATTGFDGTVRLWEPGTWRALLVLTQFTGRVWSLAFMPDGRSLITITDKELTVWDTGEWKPRFNRPYEGAYSAIAVCPKGRYFITARGDDATLWDLNGALQERVLPGMRQYIAFSPDGSMVAAASTYGIKLWRLEPLQELGEIADTRGERYSTPVGKAITFSPDGKLLVVGRQAGEIELFDVPSGRRVGQLTGHSSTVWFCFFLPDGKTLVSVGDRTIRLWDPVAQTNIVTLSGQGTPMHVVFAPDGRHLLSGEGNGEIKIWDTQAQRTEPRLFSYHGQPWMASDAETLALWETGAVLRIVQTRTGRELATFALPGADRTTVGRVSPDGRMVWTRGSNGAMQVWSIDSQQTLASFAPLAERWITAGFSADSQTFVTESPDHTITLWSLPEGTRQGSFAGETDPTGYSRFVALHGKRLFARGPGFALKLFDTATGEERQTFRGHKDRIEGLAFSPDEKRLAVVSRGSAVFVHDAVTGRVEAILRGHGNSVYGVEFSPDGRTLATGSGDRTVKLWNVRTWEETITLRGHTREVRWLGFSSDGSTLASYGLDRKLLFWRAATLAESDAGARVAGVR